MDFFGKEVKQRTSAVVLILLLLAGAFSSGVYVGSDGQNAGIIPGATIFSNDAALPPTGVDFGPLWKAWNVLTEKYVPASSTSTISDEKKLWGAIEGLAGSLDDPYTVFLPPEDNAQFAEDISGNFQGVGMEIGMRDGILTVIAPLKGTPAERAGIRSGDRIIRIGEETTDKLTVDKAVRLIRGERGTTVTLTIEREGEPELLEINVTRDVITIPTIDTEVREGGGGGGAASAGSLRADGVFVIRLHNFSAISPGLFRGALREFVESNTDRLILDLRGNPGGFLEAAVDMASWFLPTGKIVVSEDFGLSGKSQVHRSRGYDVFNENLKMIILINQGSASASEILAGALQEHGIATLVGAPTFGKGSVQEVVKITDDTSLKVTVARWLTPAGRSISDGGLTPDVVVPLTSEDIVAKRDPQLDKAIEILLTQ